MIGPVSGRVISVFLFMTVMIFDDQNKLADRAGLEPAASDLTERHSDQLSYLSNNYGVAILDRGSFSCRNSAIRVPHSSFKLVAAEGFEPPAKGL